MKTFKEELVTGFANVTGINYVLKSFFFSFFLKLNCLFDIHNQPLYILLCFWVNAFITSGHRHQSQSRVIAHFFSVFCSNFLTIVWMIILYIYILFLYILVSTISDKHHSSCQSDTLFLFLTRISHKLA